MLYSVQVVLVVILTIAFTIFFASIAYAFRKTLVSGGKTGIPLGLPYVAAVWTGLVIVFTFVARTYAAKSNQLGITSANWFTAGWKGQLTYFGIPIDTWWRYLIVVCYQVGRSILGSLISNVFKPFLLSEVQNQLLNTRIDSTKTAEIIMAQGFVTMFGYVSALTDLFLFLSQLDMSLITVAITLISDSASTYSILAIASERKNQTTKDQKEAAVKELGEHLVQETPDTKSILTRTVGANAFGAQRFFLNF
jgi:hypothetical protein